jgi:predicted alpha/beta-fold hydrolase
MKHDEYDEKAYEKMEKSTSLYDFDNEFRAKILGYNSVHGLYRNVSW